MNEDKRNVNIPKDQFEFVQRGEKIFDKKFETKPVGYFRDAMSRFGKNKTNMVATIILGFIISLAIFVPIFSTKNYTALEEQLSHLPPRVPLIENLGFMDGTSKKVRQTVDLETYDIRDNTGLPVGYEEEFIIPDTSTIYTQGCTDKEKECIGGENSLKIENETDNVAIFSPNFSGLLVNSFFNPMVEFNINHIDEDTVVNLYIRYKNSDWIPNEPYEKTSCSGDEVLHLGQCYDKVVQDTCPDGELSVDGECVVVEESPICKDNQLSVDGNCVRIPAIATCEEDYYYEDGECKEATKTCPEEYVLNGQAFDGEECVDITDENQLAQHYYERIASTTETGLLEIALVDVLGNRPVMFQDAAIVIEIESPVAHSKAVFDSLRVYDTRVDGEFDYVSVSGYNLSKYEILSDAFIYNNGTEDVTVLPGAGSYTRQNGIYYFIDFRYEDYNARFADKNEPAFAKSKFLEAVEAHPDVCIMPDEELGETLTGWEFEKGCPVVRVYDRTESVFVPQTNDANDEPLPDVVTEEICEENGYVYQDKDEEQYCALETYSYNVDVDYAILTGYDDIPYFLFGTTAAGRDLFTLIWVATRTSLLIGVIVASINITVGIIYGSISGYYGGLVDLIMQRFSEVVGRVPWIVTLSIFVSIFGPGIMTLIYILIFAGWIGVAAITRTQFYRYKGREYVLASRTLGARDARLIFRHILPNGIGTIITSSILSIPGVIFAESTISYLGFGIGHGQEFKLFGITFSGVSIGVLLAEARTYLLTKPYLTLFPAIVISILMITFNMFGNALRDAFNPSLRGSE